MILCDKSIVGPWIAFQANMIWRPEGSETIGLVRNGNVVAGVWYEDYNRQSVVAHIAIAERLTPWFLHVIFHYPFIRMGVQKIVAPVLADNELSVHLVKKMGFIEEARLKDVHPTGDMIFFVANNKNCKYLEDRYGKR